MNFQNDILPLKDKLFRLALRITMQREEAEDVVQETMIKMWNNRHNLEKVESIEAYAMTVCRNIALDHQRQATSHAEKNAAITIEGGKMESLNPYERMFYKEKLYEISRLMDQLPEKQRTCMQLRDFEGYNYKEIADMLQITEDQVKVNIFRARTFLKKNCTIV